MVKRRDRVRGWFGVGIVTDVAFGQLEDQSGEPIGKPDDMVRIIQYKKNKDKPHYRYIYAGDIEEIL